MEKTIDAVDTEIQQTRASGLFWQVIIVVLIVAGVFVAVNEVFLLGLLGPLEYENASIYLYFATFLSVVFVMFPATKKVSGASVPWYDILLFACSFAICAFLATQAVNITHKGWDFMPPAHIGVIGGCLCLLVLEAARRSSGTVLTLICAVFALYPSFADHMPGFLRGAQLTIDNVVAYHALGNSSLLGVTMRIFGRLIAGYLIFGAVLVVTGGGKFFLDVAYALVGTQRGGAAKIAIVASSFFASISGSVTANVITTGSVTIPAMKKAGYPPHFAGAIEAAASTGGTITPPVMGAVGFIMASWLGIPYFQVALAAAIPSFLYYLALFFQVDAYAVKHQLKGLTKTEVPPLILTLKKGWYYVFSFVVLIYMMYLRKEGQAPFVASAILLATAMMNRETRLYPLDFFKLFLDMARILAYITALLTAIGFVVGSLAVTGLGPAFSSEAIALAGGNLILLLIIGAFSCFVLGMGMTVTACYIFLAILLVPALISVGLNPVAAHLFVIYWGLSSAITPPVAIGAYAASGIAKASPIKTGFQAMRLGIVIYMVPFMFVLSPVLVLQGPLEALIVPLLTAVFGIILLAASLESYLLGFGRLKATQRVPIFFSALLLTTPGWETDLMGGGLIAVLLLIHLVARSRSRRKRIPLKEVMH